ncbi:MAG: 50S ribosomal protein L13, partial [Acidimicrobiia bacterium]
VTGHKEDEKIYYRHSGYPGGLRASSLRHVRETFPDRIITNAVKGMLPKNRLGRQILGKLKVYAGPEHPHAAQQPQPLDIRKVRA